MILHGSKSSRYIQASHHRLRYTRETMAGSAIVREFDYFKIEKDVNEALQAAADGKLLPQAVKLSSLPAIPASAAAEKATRWAHDDLDPSIFAHCFRTYYFGTAIAGQLFPDWEWDVGTFYLAAILHDIKCSRKAFEEAAVSFEFHGGMAAREFLVGECGAGRAVGDTVMEAICRHKVADTSAAGYSPEGQMLRFGAQLDSLGTYAGLIHSATIADVVRAYPRANFNNIFADLLLHEVHVKRFCTSASLLPQLADIIRINPAMAPYDHQDAPAADRSA